MKLYYLPIEPYKERYTELLMGWTVEAIHARAARTGSQVCVVTGERREGGIQTGRVLDAHGRSIWAMTQMVSLLQILDSSPATSDDIIYIDDMFHPGFEALPYLFDQTCWPRVYVRNHAQSVDQHDFTHPMRGWMRHYEQMVCSRVSGVICASTCHREAMQVANWDVPIHVLGLPFNGEAVRSIAGWPHALSERENRPPRVMYASRWDFEKQPHFFLEMVKRLSPHVEFVACTGSRDLRGTDKAAIEEAVALEKKGWLRIVRGADKKTYYREMSECRAHFLASLQDYVSYCLLDASALDVATVAPAYKSFPEVLHYDHTRLYVPWSAEDAEEKLHDVVMRPQDYPSLIVGQPAAFHGATLDRIMDLFDGDAPERHLS